MFYRKKSQKKRCYSKDNYFQYGVLSMKLLAKCPHFFKKRNTQIYITWKQYFFMTLISKYRILI